PEIALRQYESEINHLIEEARYLEALAHTRHILSQHPRYIGAYYLLGKTMLEADQPELAIDMFQRALNADPEHLMARIGLMMAHQRLDNTNAAI
uniref:tetratricopeptide repeat protein n=1 Tax=Klebsiella pneumoniae TaxID=573 RepID=UPI001179B1E3